LADVRNPGNLRSRVMSIDTAEEGTMASIDVGSGSKGKKPLDSAPNQPPPERLELRVMLNAQGFVVSSSAGESVIATMDAVRFD
jgi:hypothetical protein